MYGGTGGLVACIIVDTGGLEDVKITRDKIFIHEYVIYH